MGEPRPRHGVSFNAEPQSAQSFAENGKDSAFLRGLRVSALQVEPEESPKPADFAQHVAVKGPLRQELDAPLGLVAAADVNSRVGVSYVSCFAFLWHGKDFLRSHPARGTAD